MRKNIIKAKEMLNRGLINKESPNSYCVDGELVHIKKEDSFTKISCTCKSCTYNNLSLCSRKIATIIYEFQDHRLKRLIRESLETAEQHKKIGLKIEPDLLINLMNDLKSFV